MILAWISCFPIELTDRVDDSTSITRLPSANCLGCFRYGSVTTNRRTLTGSLVAERISQKGSSTLEAASLACSTVCHICGTCGGVVVKRSFQIGDLGCRMLRRMARCAFSTAYIFEQRTPIRGRSCAAMTASGPIGCRGNGVQGWLTCIWAVSDGTLSPDGGAGGRGRVGLDSGLLRLDLIRITIHAAVKEGLAHCFCLNAT